MPASLSISAFIHAARHIPVIDVRTPAEFQNGHIPGAVNIPLFTNDERVVVGTIYKQQGSEEAIKKGLEMVGPKLNLLIESIKPHVVNNQILIHCWRGGMRSSSVAWLMELTGIKTFTLTGGYKSFRTFMRSQFEKTYNLRVLGGCTGSGKSKVLHELKNQGQTIIDLETLACHKGSSFGHLGQNNFVTQEMFENLLAWELLKINSDTTVWIEDESKMIGRKNIPRSFYLQMFSAPVFVLDVPVQIRAEYLTREYGKFSKEELIEATKRIEKRLGPGQCKQAVEFISNDNLTDSCKISLVYYDKAYKHGLSKRNQALVFYLPFNKINFACMASELIKQTQLKLHAAG
jgi:tRNA 2-selenouridine synthase